jgi:hypothetical protein
MSTTGLVCNFASREPGAALQPDDTGGALDPLLTRHLEREHLQLMELYGQSHLLLSGGDQQGAQHRLGTLMVRLRDHARRKETTLYAALAVRHAFDPFITAVLRDAQALSQAVAESAAQHYQGLGQPLLEEEEVDAMKARLHGLGSELTHSIELDVAMLFPLYRKALHETEDRTLA